MKPDTLDRMLLRSLWRLRGQSLAIAFVIGAGVALYIMSVGALSSIQTTRTAYYERYRLADVFAPAKRAPLSLVHRISAIPGVRRAEERISGGVLLDVPGFDEPVNAIVHSTPQNTRSSLNAVHLVRGRLPMRPDEALVSEPFAKAHGLRGGNPIFAIIKGKKQPLRIVGTALSPEHVFTIPPGNLTTDDLRFGVLWLNRGVLEAAFDQEGAFNELLVALDPRGRTADVVANLDRLLGPYGGTGAYARADLVSDKFLRSEMDQLATMASILPPLFMAVAAFLLWVMAGRVIDTDREEIGLLKAFGYRNVEIGAYYAKLVTAIALVGVGIGCAAGAWLGHGITTLYAGIYHFPFLVFHIPSTAYAAAVSISITAALFGAFLPVMRAVNLPPVMAMEPAPPTSYAGWTQRMLGRFSWFDEPSRMILRHLARWPLRTSLSIAGISMALGLCIASGFNLDAIGKMLDFTFNYTARQDATLTFAEPQSITVMADISRLPGVLAAEPMRAVPVRLRHRQRTRLEALTAVSASANLNRLVDDNWTHVSVPDRGVVLTQALATKLDAHRGSILRVEVLEGKRPIVDLPVVQVVPTYLGTGAYVDFRELDRIMTEATTASGAYLKIDRAQETALFRAAKTHPLIAGIALRHSVLENFETQVRENIGTFRFYNLLLSSIIVVGVVYNNARLSFSERARELATMRVLGYRRRDVSYILVGELLMLTLVALPFGIAFGAGFAWYIAQSFSSDIYTIPFALSSATIGFAMGAVLFASMATALLVRRRLDKLDLIRVLKSRE